MTTQQKINKFGAKHPLNAAFIVEAIHKYADNILENEEQVLKDMKGGFIDGESWVGIAREVKKELS